MTLTCGLCGQPGAVCFTRGPAHVRCWLTMMGRWREEIERIRAFTTKYYSNLTNNIPTIPFDTRPIK